jgi:hypothetical protein
MKRVHVSGVRVGRDSAAVSLFGTVVLGLCCSVASGCEAEKPKAAPPAIAAPSVAPVAVAPKPKEPPKSSRPEKIDVTVTPARKSEIEGAYAEAKGFAVSSEIEESLKKNKALKDKGPALKAFDKAAQGKWVLFSGPIVNFYAASRERSDGDEPSVLHGHFGRHRRLLQGRFQGRTSRRGACEVRRQRQSQQGLRVGRDRSLEVSCE